MGVLVYLVICRRLSSDRGIWRTPLRENISLPTRDVLWFAVPLLTSPLVWTAFTLGSSTALAWWYDSAAIADYLSVWSAARLNMVVASTFGVLFLPSLARLVVQGVGSRIHSAYWRTSGWVAALTLPAFSRNGATGARHDGVSLWGKIPSSATVLAIVSFGIYVDVVFGFNRQTLELYGRVWTVVASDVVTMIANLALVLALVPEFGPNGAAVATAWRTAGAQHGQPVVGRQADRCVLVRSRLCGRVCLCHCGMGRHRTVGVDAHASAVCLLRCRQWRSQSPPCVSTADS